MFALKWSMTPARWRRLLTVALIGGSGCASPIHLPEPIPAFMRDDIGLRVLPPDSPVYQNSFEILKQNRPANADPEKKDGPKPLVSLPEAIEETIAANLRVRVGMEKVQLARGELTSASIIPNPSLQLDTQFLPLPGAHPYSHEPNNNIGPLQYDALVAFPIDWFVFGKRVAAMRAARLGVDVAAADFADLVRKQVSATLEAFYDILEAKAQVKLAREDLDDLKRIEKITAAAIKGGGAGTIELDRIRLAVLDSQRELRRRETILLTTRSKLRPLIGRRQIDADFDVVGELGVQGTMTAPSIEEAIASAETNRPDILSDLRDIRRAEAALASEERKAKPLMQFQAGMSYQQTKFYTGLPGKGFTDLYLTTTLPTTDRNQGGIAKAMSDLRNKHMTLQADLADLRAEVEQALESYRTALQIVTTDDPATLKSAKEVRDKTEAAFEKGGRRLIEVLDAQRVYRDRIRSSISGQADYFRALNRLNAAIGIRLALPPVKQPERPPGDMKEDLPKK
jgi:cobalt-zinc-cadmium efflux system outer membrane protein